MNVESVRRLQAVSDAELGQLVDVLTDCVEGGASVSFLLPFDREVARAFWSSVARAVAAGDRALLVAEDALGICGTAQLALAQPPNQPHRADVSKVLVHRRARRQGLGAALMRAVEATARECGKDLLVLDTVTGSDAQRLYERLGWVRVGDIPRFALLPTGEPCSTTYYYRDLRADAALLAEQVAYYRAIAAEYESLSLPGWGGPEVAAALEAFRPAGEVLELACGPGMWTGLLLRHATSVTAVDAAPEMLARARATVGEERVRFVQADLFSWRPERRYDVVFFGFWLSHVPRERFAAFWSLVDECLKPGGRVIFVDDALRLEEELIEGEASSTIQRRLPSGTAYQIVKVPYRPGELEQQLALLGWQVTVTRTSGHFYWGAGARSGGQ